MGANLFSEFSLTGDALFDRFGQAISDLAEGMARARERYVEVMIADHALQHLRGNPEALREALLEAAGKDEDFNARHPELAKVRAESREVSAAVIHSWAGEFGQDPRYWQLLSQVIATTSCGGETVEEHYSRLVPDQYQVLIEAYQEGVADGLTLLMLKGLFEKADPGYVDQQISLQKLLHQRPDPQEVAAHLRASIESLKDRWGDKHPERLEGLEESLKEWENEGPPEPWVDKVGQQLTHEHFEHDNRLAKKLVAELGLSLSELHDAAVKASPDWAQVYYERAAHLAQKGLFKEAVRDVETGNKAFTNRKLVPFPASFALQYALDIGIPGSLAALSKSKLMAQRNEDGGVVWGQHQILTKLEEAFSQKERLSTLVALVQQTCRYTQADLASKEDGRMGLFVIGKALEEFTSFLMALGQTQPVSLLSGLQARCNEAMEQLLERNFELPDLSEMPERTFPLSLAEEGELWTFYYKAALTEWMKDRRILVEDVWPFIEEVKEFDFRALTTRTEEGRDEV